MLVRRTFSDASWHLLRYLFVVYSYKSIVCFCFFLKDDTVLAENVAAETEAAKMENSEISQENQAILAKIKQTQRKDYIDVR